MRAIEIMIVITLSLIVFSIGLGVKREKDEADRIKHFEKYIHTDNCSFVFKTSKGNHSIFIQPAKRVETRRNGDIAIYSKPKVFLIPHQFVGGPNGVSREQIFEKVSKCY